MTRSFSAPLSRREWLTLATAGVLGGSQSGWLERLAADTGSETTTSHHLIFGNRILCLEESKASTLRPASHQKNIPTIGQLRSLHGHINMPLGVHSLCAGLRIA